MKALFYCLFLSVAALPAVAADLFTSRVYTRQEFHAQLLAVGVPANRLPGLAGTHYAQFVRAEVPTFHALTRYRLSKRYGPRWNERFNCYGISWLFVTEATLELAAEKFYTHLPTPSAVERAALLVISYNQGGPGGQAHSINLFLTDAGPLWWDAQKGEVAALTPAEAATVFWPQ